MLIRMEYIARELRDCLLAEQIASPSELMSFSIRDPAAAPADPSVLYLLLNMGEAEEIGASTAGLNFLVLSDRDVIPENLRANNILICRSGSRDDVYTLINQLNQIFQRYSAWEQNLIRAVARNVSFQEMLDIGYEMLGWPMAMMDLNHNMLAVTRSDRKDDPFLFCLRGGYGAEFLSVVSRSLPTLEEVKAKGVVERISNISFLRIRVKHIQGPHLHSFFLGLHKGDDQPFSAADVRLFDVFCEYLEVLSMKKKPVTPVFTDPLTPFLEESILNKDAKTEDLLEILKAEGAPNTGRWQLLGVKFRNQLRFRTDFHYEVIRQLKNVLPPCHFALIDSHIVMLFENSTPIGEYEEALQYAMVVHEAVCAFSSPYTHLTDTGRIWNQILFMMDDANCPDGGSIRYYTNYYRRHALALIRERFPAEVLPHIAFQKLRQYDDINNTSYYHTLLVYLRNFGSKSLTADELNIHKNSLLYRIQKIEELLGVESDRSEFPYLAFSALLLEEGEPNV